MIKQVIINNGFGEKLTINLPQTEPDHGLFITEIEGLGPVKADINTGKLATSDGDIFNSARANHRDISIHFLYLDSDGVSAEQARLNTYRFFPLKEQVSIYIRTENRYVKTEGYVESNEPDIFSEMSGSTVTINCQSPWFNLVGVNRVDNWGFSNLSESFQFKFTDEPTPSLIFSEFRAREPYTFYYPGEVRTGVVLSIRGRDKFHQFFRNPTIYNLDTGERLFINTDKIEKMLNPDWNPNVPTIGPGDEIVISSIVGKKYARYIREGETYNILSLLDLDVYWPTLHPGKNTFGYKCNPDDTQFDMKVTMKAPILVQGV